jgi:hypothetical protein
MERASKKEESVHYYLLVVVADWGSQIKWDYSEGPA